jgi:predicted dehydrogenase
MQPHSTRREFLKSSSSLAALSLAPAVHVGGSDTIRVGLVGCGGRGTGAAAQALRADPNARLVAMGDAFRERIDRSLHSLSNPEQQLAGKIGVGEETKFTGVDCYRQVIDAVDVVVLCEPPHFRPRSLAYAVEKGRHAFVEKPIAVDAPGVRKVLATCELARQKKLAIVSGLCWRYDPEKRATMQAIHDGHVGDIVAIQANYVTGGLWMHKRKPEWSDMEWQLRNWLYFTWLSGDHIVEQHIHSLDKAAWAMKDEYPVRAVSLGGRQVRTGAEYGHIYDHFATFYEYGNGVRLYSYCRQQNGCWSETNDYVLGTKGRCDVFKHRISGEKPWECTVPRGDMYQLEHDALFASIRSGTPIHNGDYMCKSTLLAIMGRMAAYTGRIVSWDEAWNSQEDLTPKSYELGEIETPPVALPGITRFR